MNRITFYILITFAITLSICFVNAQSKTASLTNEVVTDIDGNTYTTVTIGTQTWLVENLKTTKYRNGDLIGTTTTVDYSAEATPKYQFAYSNNVNNVANYGRLYTWFAATDPRGIAPVGYRLPTDQDLITLASYLIENGDIYSYDGLKNSGTVDANNQILKALASTSLWTSTTTVGTPGNNRPANNASGFNLTPGGVRRTGSFTYSNQGAFIWTLNETSASPANAIARWSFYNNTSFNTRTTTIDNNSNNKKNGLSIKCIKGEVNYWVGTNTTAWDNASNWSLNVVPNSTDLIVIKSSSNNPVIGTTVSCKDLIIEPGGILTIAATGKLEVTGTFTNRVGNAGLIIESNASGTGSLKHITAGVNATVKQYLSTPRNWYISSPISNSTVPTGNTYYKYIEAGTNPSPVAPATAYWASVAEGTALVAGTGYIAKPSVASTLTYSGTLNAGNVDYTLSRSGAVSTGFNLVGNPYTSHIKFTDAIATTANIEASIWFRTAAYSEVQSKYIYSFISYNAPSGLSVPADASDGYVPPMQAFWVRANTAGTLRFTNDMRVQSSGASTQLRAPKATINKILRLQITNGATDDETLIYFNANASNGFDRFDSPKMANPAAEVEIFSITDSERLVINGLNTMVYDQSIPIGFTSKGAANLRISVSEMSNFEKGTKLILKNNETLVETELSEDAAFYLSKQDAIGSADAYSLILRAPGTTNKLERMEQNTRIYVNAGKKIVVKFNEVPENALVKVYNTLGQTIADKAISEVSTELNVTPDQGIYLVKVYGNGSVVSKIIVVN